MTPAIVPAKSDQKLRALDPNLPSLASEAAIDIDNLLSGGPQDLRAIQKLAERLKNTIELTDTADPPRSLMDPATLIILGEAIGEATKDRSLSKVEDLLKEASKISESLSRDDLEENPAELKQARDFCIALSRAAMAYHKSISDLRPSHPFRR